MRLNFDAKILFGKIAHNLDPEADLDQYAARQ